MNIYAWIGIIGIVFFTGVPLMIESQRTKANILQFVKSIFIVLVIILLVEVMLVPFIFAFIIGIILFILFDKKTYTKKRLIIYGPIIGVFIITLYILFKNNPDYVLKHLEKNPESTSLYVMLNNEEVITYKADIPRPLASVVKIIIAVEYAYQLENGDLNKDTTVSLDTLNLYYIENTDGGAHEHWLDLMVEEQKIHDNKVELHEVAKGMITFSSNANTDYLIDLLGVENINARINELELVDHDDVYPLAGALLTSHEFKQKQSDSDWLKKLRSKSDEKYKQLALDQSEKMKNEDIDLKDGIDLKVKEQRVWSDRLPKAPASTYGKLLYMIANESFPSGVSTIIREIMEWPMEMVEGNKDHYHYVGAKGGSTAFVYNQAMYVETLGGDQFEIVLLMDDLSFWESTMLQFHTNSFIVELVNNEDFLEKVQSEL